MSRYCAGAGLVNEVQHVREDTFDATCHETDVGGACLLHVELSANAIPACVGGMTTRSPAPSGIAPSMPRAYLHLQPALPTPHE